MKKSGKTSFWKSTNMGLINCPHNCFKNRIESMWAKVHTSCFRTCTTIWSTSQATILKDSKHSKPLLDIDWWMVMLKICKLTHRESLFTSDYTYPTKQDMEREPRAILSESVEIIAAHDECLGGNDGACRHVAAGLFELEKIMGEVRETLCTDINHARGIWKPLTNNLSLSKS